MTDFKFVALHDFTLEHRDIKAGDGFDIDAKLGNLLCAMGAASRNIPYADRSMTKDDIGNRMMTARPKRGRRRKSRGEA